MRAATLTITVFLWASTLGAPVHAAQRPKTRDRFAHVDRLMRLGVERDVFESAVLLVSHHGQPLFHQAYGGAGRDSLFDLASLTKPLATTAVAMRLIDQGKLHLDARLGDLLPESASAPAGRVTVRQLLSHTSGLPARNDFSDRVKGLPAPIARRFMAQLAATRPLRARPGSATLYSDLNFILLGAALERVGGKRLDHLAAELVFDPLSLTHTGFLPADGRVRAGLHPRDAIPTEEIAPGQRHRGQVHDEKARDMGGVSGSAGLFASATDVQRIADELVAAYRGEPTLFAPDVVRRFLDAPSISRDDPRALGWARPSPAGSRAGQRFDRQTTIGFTGFTGTSLWVDLQRELSVVLLTNRVYYGRDRAKIDRFSPVLHDAVHDAALADQRRE